jgi:hypothetical protein
VAQAHSSVHNWSYDVPPPYTARARTAADFSSILSFVRVHETLFCTPVCLFFLW